MSDFTEAQGVKTFRDDEFKNKIVDGQSGVTATKVLTVEQDLTAKSAGVNDFAIPVLFKTDEATPVLVIPRTDPDGNTKVVVVPSSDTDKILDYNKHDSIAKDAVSNHDVVVTDLKTAKRIKVLGSSLGLVKYEVGTWNGVDTFVPWATFISSPAHPTEDIELPDIELVGDGTVGIRVIVTNLDRANDIYTTIQFREETT